MKRNNFVNIKKNNCKEDFAIFILIMNVDIDRKQKYMEKIGLEKGLK